MSQWALIWKREVLRALFQPSFYGAVAVFSAMTGLNFWKQVRDNVGECVAIPVLLFGSLFFWVLVVLWASVLTLRTFPEESRNGTLELWLAAPVRERNLVTGKFAAVWTLFLIGTLPLFLFIPLLRWAEGTAWQIPWTEIVTGMAGLWVIGGLLLAIGIAVGLAWEAPIPAFPAVFAALLVAFFAQVFCPLPGLELPRWWYGLMLMEQASDFARGVVDSRAGMALGSGIVFFLFLSVRLLQLKRLR